jgi:hypothetical protein
MFMFIANSIAIVEIRLWKRVAHVEGGDDGERLELTLFEQRLHLIQHLVSCRCRRHFFFRW